MTADEVLDDWFLWLCEQDVCLHADPADDAGENRVLFSLADARDAGATPGELGGFLLRALAHFRGQHPGEPDGWFYAWHDLLAGQLRLCLGRAGSAEELPFRAAYRVSEDPVEIAVDGLASPFLDGILWEQLEEDEGEPLDEAPPILTVFAARL
jgi:hypothetical protein